LNQLPTTELYIIFSMQHALWARVSNVLTGTRLNHVSLCMKNKQTGDMYVLHSDINIGCRWLSYKVFKKVATPLDVYYMGDIFPPEFMFNDKKDYYMNPWLMTLYWILRPMWISIPPNCCTLPVLSWLSYFKNIDFNSHKTYSPKHLWKELNKKGCKLQPAKNVTENWKCKSLL